MDKRRSFYKTLVKRAELQVFDRLDSARAGWEEQATEIVLGRAKKRKLEFEEAALELFVLLTGGDTRQIDNELEKIDTFLGKDRAVSVELVRELVPLQLYLNDKDGVLPVINRCAGHRHECEPGDLPEVHRDKKSFPVAF